MPQENSEEQGIKGIIEKTAARLGWAAIPEFEFSLDYTERGVFEQGGACWCSLLSLGEDNLR
ncbi:MAG: hypothetical protein KKC75_05040 [Nanoarchaeota archaeon]|nr:hypothetical protein [Nanoarchaeota archaeon]MBU1946061.1 hypothetical protein [Nanoarchaeota archaeon]